MAEVPEPATAAGEALVRVTAAGVTPFDHSVLTGKRPVAKTSPVVPGGEGAGRVISDPTGRFCPGDRVVFSAGSAPAGRDGTFAERVAVDARYLTGIPDGISDEVAAGLPVAYLTAFFALRQARFAAGQSVLATGVGGSVGNATLRLAHALGASKLVSTAGSEQKLKASQQDATLPPTQVVLLTSESLADGLHRTAPEGIDVVIDALGGPLFGQALAGLATYGRAVSVGYSAGVRSEIAITDLIWKRAILSGFALV
ncbi:MAG TPA: zinc-binding dehydrogenase, partial [Streptosporangiaceae bacterium]|nr:zinc-binding dehydrogenase [Streptosporangiaceae bacterium]